MKGKRILAFLLVLAMFFSSGIVLTSRVSEAEGATFPSLSEVTGTITINILAESSSDIIKNISYTSSDSIEYVSNLSGKEFDSIIGNKGVTQHIEYSDKYYKVLSSGTVEGPDGDSNYTVKINTERVYLIKLKVGESVKEELYYTSKEYNSNKSDLNNKEFDGKNYIPVNTLPENPSDAKETVILYKEKPSAPATEYPIYKLVNGAETDTTKKTTSLTDDATIQAAIKSIGDPDYYQIIQDGKTYYFKSYEDKPANGTTHTTQYVLLNYVPDQYRFVYKDTKGAVIKTERVDRLNSGNSYTMPADGTIKVDSKTYKIKTVGTPQNLTLGCTDGSHIHTYSCMGEKYYTEITCELVSSGSATVKFITPDGKEMGSAKVDEGTWTNSTKKTAFFTTHKTKNYGGLVYILDTTRANVLSYSDIINIPYNKASVTIKYVDEKGNSVKTSVTRDRQTTDSSNITTDDKKDITYNGKTYKYKNYSVTNSTPESYEISLVFSSEETTKESKVEFIDADTKKVLKSSSVDKDKWSDGKGAGTSTHTQYRNSFFNSNYQLTADGYIYLLSSVPTTVTQINANPIQLQYKKASVKLSYVDEKGVSLDSAVASRTKARDRKSNNADNILSTDKADIIKDGKTYKYSKFEVVNASCTDSKKGADHYHTYSCMNNYALKLVFKSESEDYTLKFKAGSEEIKSSQKIKKADWDKWSSIEKANLINKNYQTITYRGTVYGVSSDSIPTVSKTGEISINYSPSKYVINFYDENQKQLKASVSRNRKESGNITSEDKAEFKTGNTNYTFVKSEEIKPTCTAKDKSGNLYGDINEGISHVHNISCKTWGANLVFKSEASKSTTVKKTTTKRRASVSRPKTTSSNKPMESSTSESTKAETGNADIVTNIKTEPAEETPAPSAEATTEASYINPENGVQEGGLMQPLTESAGGEDGSFIITANYWLVNPDGIILGSSQNVSLLENGMVDPDGDNEGPYTDNDTLYNSLVSPEFDGYFIFDKDIRTSASSATKYSNLASAGNVVATKKIAILGVLSEEVKNNYIIDVYYAPNSEDDQVMSIMNVSVGSGNGGAGPTGGMTGGSTGVGGSAVSVNDITSMLIKDDVTGGIELVQVDDIETALENFASAEDELLNIFLLIVVFAIFAVAIIYYRKVKERKKTIDRLGQQLEEIASYMQA